VEAVERSGQLEVRTHRTGGRPWESSIHWTKSDVPHTQPTLRPAPLPSPSSPPDRFNRECFSHTARTSPFEPRLVSPLRWLVSSHSKGPSSTSPPPSLHLYIRHVLRLTIAFLAVHRKDVLVASERWGSEEETWGPS